MAARIEDYALLGDTQAAALVSRDGSIDWLCLPRFDSEACFAALLGDEDNGRWHLRPQADRYRVRRRYRERTLVLETEFETPDGTVAVIDFMEPRGQQPDLLRIVEGRTGRVPMRMDLTVRFDYGATIPWVRQLDGGLQLVAGPNALSLHTPVETRGVDRRTVAEFEVAAGERVPFVMCWYESHRDRPRPHDAEAALESTESWWRAWARQCRTGSRYDPLIVRSLLTLKALTYAPTGGIVAAATTSLPEKLGGVRNWDYRFCWLRDATFTLQALLGAGYVDEAIAWRDWLLRAVAGDPGQLQIMYGPAGERRLTEFELDHLSGYEGSRPVRVGNAAIDQFQLDVFGEVMDAMHQARVNGVEPHEDAWNVQQAFLDTLEGAWREPDEGIWEVRTHRRHFTHSKVMAWLAFDRAVKAVERFGLDGPADRWRSLRDEVHAEVCERGVDPERGCFVQSYGDTRLDASLLMIPLVGFLPPTDARVADTVRAIEEVLCEDGFVHRYEHDPEVDGLPPGEGAFLMCTFWLVDNLVLLGERERATELFDRLTALTNDVGLLAEEYDPSAGRMLGNFPQAFSHVSLVNSALRLDPGAAGSEEVERERS